MLALRRPALRRRATTITPPDPEALQGNPIFQPEAVQHKKPRVDSLPEETMGEIMMKLGLAAMTAAMFLSAAAYAETPSIDIAQAKAVFAEAKDISDKEGGHL